MGEEDMPGIKCPSCGHDAPGGKFCPECGAPLTAKAKPATKKGKNTAVRDLSIVAAALVAVTAGYFLLKEPEQVPQPPQQQQQGQMPEGHEGMDMSQMSNIQFPPDYASLVQMGNQTMDAGNFAVAAEAYRRSLELDPSSVNVRTDFGACLHGMGLPNRALEEFYRVIKEHPEHSIANFNIGIVYHGLAREDSAKIYWEKYLRIDPNGSAAEAARNYLQQLGG